MGETSWSWAQRLARPLSFSILKRIVMGETKYITQGPRSITPFSILKRIVMGETEWLVKL